MSWNSYQHSKVKTLMNCFLWKKGPLCKIKPTTSTSLKTHIPTQIAVFSLDHEFSKVRLHSDSCFSLKPSSKQSLTVILSWSHTCANHLSSRLFTQMWVPSVWSCQQLHWTQTQFSLPSKVTLVSSQKKKRNISHISQETDSLCSISLLSRMKYII